VTRREKNKKQFLGGGISRDIAGYGGISRMGSQQNSNQQQATSRKLKAKIVLSSRFSVLSCAPRNLSAATIANLITTAE
jgi:hypothetical protein